MKNIHLNFAVIALTLTSIFYACQKEVMSKNGPSKLTVFLTDHATPVFDSVFIDIQKLEVKLEDDTLSNGGWIELTIRPGVYNILRFRNGLDTLFANGTLSNNRIRKIRLALGTQNSVMKDGQLFPLRIKDNEKQVVANIDNSNFDIAAPDQVFFWIDFDAGRSIQVDNSGSGNNNSFELKAHIRVFGKRNSGSIEGSVSPKAADPVVMAITGSDTTMAIPDDDDGEFKIVGLNAGSYKVLIDGNNGYSDTTIVNVVVRNNENTHLPAIILHR